MTERFIQPEHRALVLSATEPSGLLDALAAWVPPPPVRKWVDTGSSTVPRRE